MITYVIIPGAWKSTGHLSILSEGDISRATLLMLAQKRHSLSLILHRDKIPEGPKYGIRTRHAEAFA